MATFSDFYKQQMAGLSAQPSAVPKLDISSTPAAGSPGGPDVPQSPLNWAIDILSRPLYGTTNALSKTRDDILSAADAGSQGDVAGAIGSGLKGALDLPLGFLEGFFSTDHSVKRTYSKVLEESTDAIGKRVDSNYVDQENNVDAGLKGGLGLALDIVADPLTWIPGAQIAAAGRFIGKGVKAGTELVGGAVKGVKDVVDTKRGVTAADDAARAAEPDNIGLSIDMPGTVPDWMKPFGGETTYKPVKVTAPEPVELKPWDVLGRKSADFYDSMVDDVANPSVLASYGALEKGITQQYRDMKAAGVKIEFSKTDPYVGKNMAQQMLDDVMKNKRLKVFADGGATLPKGHPLNKVVDIDGERLHLNDVFRAVHDFMGHAKSGQRGAVVKFDPQGEWEAWRTHRLSLPRESWQALWTETRGQNAWTNYFGKNADIEKLADRPFAVQKTGVVPEELFAADLIGGEGSTLRDLIQSNPMTAEMRDEISSIRASVGKKTQAQTMNQWVKANKAKVVPYVHIVGSRGSGPMNVETLANIVAGDLKANKGVMSARGQSALNILQNEYRKSGAVKEQIFSNAFEAFKAKQAEDMARLTNIFGPRLIETLAAKNSPAAFGRTFSALNAALDPATDLAVFAQRNKGLLAVLKDTMAIPEHIKPSANTFEELARADSLYAELGTVNRTYTKTLDDYTALHPHKRGVVAFSEGDAATRTAIRVNESNTMTQYLMSKGFKDEIDRRMVASTGRDELFGADRAKARRDVVDGLWDEIAETAITKGMPLNIGIGKDLVPLSAGEVYRSVYLGFADEEKALLLLHNLGSAVALTPLLQSAHKAVMAGDLVALGEGGVIKLRKELIDDLLDPKKYGVKGEMGQTLPSNFQKTNARGYNYVTREQAEAAAKKLPNGKVVVGKSKTTGNPSFHVTFSARALAEDLVDAIILAQPKLVEKAAANAVAWKARAGDEGSKIYNSIISEIQDAITGGASSSTVISAVQNIPGAAVKVGTGMGATQLGVDIATSMSHLGVGSALLDEANIAAKLTRDLTDVKVSFGEAFDQATMARIEQGVAEVAESNKALAAAKFDDPAQITEAGAVKVDIAESSMPVKDLSSMDEADTLMHVQGKFFPLWTHRMFNQDVGVERVIDAYRASDSAANMFLHTYSRRLSDLARKYPVGDTRLAEAFAAIQRGDAPAHLQEAIDDLTPVLLDLLPVGDRVGRRASHLDMSILRADAHVKHVNDALAQAFAKSTYPKPPAFDWGAAKLAAKEAGKKKPTNADIADQLVEQWKSWAVKDPLDFLSRFSAATATVVERKTAMGYFVKHFTDLGLASTKPKPGMVKIVASGDSTYRSYLPKEFYADPDLAGELHRLDWLTRVSTNMGGDVGHFLNTYFLPVQNLWKKGITIMRPGHHIRNFVGDSSITWLVRGNRHFIQAYKDAWKVLGFKNNYSDFDVIDGMRRMEEGAFRMPTGGDVLLRGKVGGKDIEITAEEIHAAAMQYGLLNTFRRAEDLLSDAVEAGRVQKITDALLPEKARIVQLAGDTSEFTAHIGRVQHFIQALDQELKGKGLLKGQFKNMDELYMKVAHEVRRTHPDGQMLTPPEKKYMRVLIPFYSWFGKTLPIALQASLRNPGRLMVLPKSSYELAVAMGINPDTLSNPFPTDQLFPSFLTDGFFGPQFRMGDKYVNVNPGFAVTDVFNSITPARSALGMVTPLIRVPAELASGGSWATGGRINDTSDYIDQNIPFVNYLANLTGVSPTGSIGSLATGQGLDPQLQVARGNKDGFDQMLTMANWLTGMNVQNWSRPNFVNFAEIEKRNRAGGN